MTTPRRRRRKIFPSLLSTPPPTPPAAPPPAAPRFRAVPVPADPPGRVHPPAPPDGPPDDPPYGGPGAASGAEPSQATPWPAAARFPVPRAALGHLAATADLGVPELRRSPYDGSVWVLLDAAHLAALPLVAAYGGTAFQSDGDGRLWPYDPSGPATDASARPTAGTPGTPGTHETHETHGHETRESRVPRLPWPPPSSAPAAALRIPWRAGAPEHARHEPPPAPRTADVAGWETLPLAELAAHSPVGAPPPGLREISVLAPGALARWLLRRCLAAGVPATFTPVERLDGAGRTDPGWLLLRLGAAGAVPQGLVEACGRLPGTVACRAADPDGRVLVDLGLRLPLDDAVLLDDAPPGRHVVVERAAAGPPWQWRPLGEAAAAELLDAGPLLGPAAAPAAVPVPVPPLGPPLPVRLVAGARAPRRVDAVLVADAELDGLRRFLRCRPLHETAVVAFGPGRHLVTEPPGLLQALPFGVPVYQAGPGALYLESGCVLNPPLPAPARDEVLGLGPDVIKVLCRDGAWQLRVADVRPAWQLWMPAAPAFESGLSYPAQELLDRLADALPAPESPAPPAVRTTETERARLNQEAMEHSLRGDYRRAAELLEQAGHFQRAAQMYERAAGELGEAR